MKGLANRWLFPAAVGCLLAGCGSKRTSDAASSASAPPAGLPSAPPAASSAPPAASSAPPGAASGPHAQPRTPPTGGVGAWEPIEGNKECASKARELEPNLASGNLSITARGKEMAVTRFFRTRTKNEGLVAFGGYDSLTRTVGASFGLGKGALLPTWVFPFKENWAVFWFDPRGLVYTRVGWAATNAKIGRLAAIPIEEAGRVNFATTSEGPLLAVSPVSVEPASQLGLFLFNPGEELAEVIKAVGATHHASRPKNPTVAPSADGYVLVWQDEAEEGKPSFIAATRFDASGKELGPQLTLSTEGRAASTPTLLPTEQGTLIAWVEQEGASSAVVVQVLDRSWQPVEAPRRIGAGREPTLALAKDGAALAFLRQAEGQPVHVAAVRLGAGGTPAAKGVVVSELKPKLDVAFPPGMVASDDGRLNVVFAYTDGMRSQMRSFKVEGCLDP